MANEPVKLTEKEIKFVKSVKSVLAKGYRVELIPLKDGGVKALRIRLDEIITNK